MKVLNTGSSGQVSSNHGGRAFPPHQIAQPDDLASCSPRMIHSAKEKRIVLIKPPLYTCESFGPIRSAQPLGIWQLGSFLQSRGYDVRLVDAVIEGWENKTYLASGKPFDYPDTLKRRWESLRLEGPSGYLRRFPVADDEGHIRRSIIRTGLSEDDIVGRVREMDPGWIGITIISTCEHRSAIDLAKRLRREFPDSKIVAGGQHATDMAGRVLLDSKGSIDFIVKGSGELAFQALLEGRRPDRGLAYMENGCLVEQPDSYLTPLDILPPLQPSLLSHIDYPFPNTHSYDTSGRKYTDFMFSFGCYKRCDFCRQGMVRDGYRHLSLDQLRSQLRLFKEHGYEEIILQDDSILGGPKNDGKAFFFEAIRMLKEFGFYYHDNGGMEIERLDRATAEAILRSNDAPGPGRCTALYVPFNPRNLDDTRIVERYMTQKAEKLELLRTLHDNGIYVFVSGIYGHVKHDIASMESDIRGYEALLEGHIADQAVVLVLSYLPRTKDWEFRHHVVDMDDWEGYSIFVPHARTNGSTFEEVNYMVLEANRRLNKLQAHVTPWASAFPPTVPDGWK